MTECVGGPLDGKRVEASGLAFPWPHGWYYLKYAGGDSPLLRQRDEAMVYAWDGEPAHYLPQDHEHWERHAPVVYA